MSEREPILSDMTVREFADSLPEGVTVQRFGVNIRKERVPTTLPTDAERAQARAEHLDAIADCFELDLDDEKPVVRISRGGLADRLWGAADRHPDLRQLIADLDEARAIRDRLAELIEEAESGGGG